jgi:two-component system KDP operon response regulator KdpE
LGATVRVLIIDDDPDILDVVSLSFEVNFDDCTVVATPDGRSGLDNALNGNFDLVVLDLGLPDVDGLEVCEDIRKVSNVPIVMLTARDRETDIVRGLNCGADDYVTKPFSQMHFMARVRAVLRRTSPEDEPAIIESGSLRVDFQRREVWNNDTLVHLTPTEYRILEILLKNADHVVTHRELLEHAWGPEYSDSTGYLKSHIRSLREKLGDSPLERTAIVTEHRVGYRFVTGT